MTTQAELAEAFARGESAPNVASNLRRIESDEGGIEYLCGGQDGQDIVLARREPIDQVYFYGMAPNFSSTYFRNRRGQQRTVVRALRQLEDDEISVQDIPERAPPIEEVETCNV